MPRHPSRDPSPSRFAPPARLADLAAKDSEQDVPRPTPNAAELSSENETSGWWFSSSTLDPHTGYAQVRAVSAATEREEQQQDTAAVPFEEGCSPLVFGGGVFGTGMYNDDSFVRTKTPLRTLRLAFRYGINAIDTSPYYYPSEFVLGGLLSALSDEYPRSSYYLCTKCGRYGPEVEDFDYSPETIRRSVAEGSLKRLGTDYLDLVCLHDAEFVAEKVRSADIEESDMGAAWACLPEEDPQGQKARKALGLAPGDEGKIRGPGDEVFLRAVAELFRLKDEGVIRRVGISGYPLPTLLRLSRLVAATAPYRPLDAVLSYSNHTLHSDILPAYVDMFQRPVPTPHSDATWKAPMILNGSPFSMGLLTDGGPPEWHPASKELKAACAAATQEISGMSHEDVGAEGTNTGSTADSVKGGKGPTMAQTALLYGIHGTEHVPLPKKQLVREQAPAQDDAVSAAQTTATISSSTTTTPQGLRTLLGMSNPDQVHQAVEAYRALMSARGSSGGGPKKAAHSTTRDSSDSSDAEMNNLRARYEETMRRADVVQGHVRKAGAYGQSWKSPASSA